MTNEKQEAQAMLKRNDFVGKCNRAEMQKAE